MAIIFGMILSAAFAPFEYSWLAWIGLIPIIHLTFLPNHRSWSLGYAFGFGHFVSTFAWLKEVFILAPLGLAAVCAIFPAFWLFLSKCLMKNLQISPTHDLLPKNDPSVNIDVEFSAWKLSFLVFAISFIWCGMEWCRSWFLSGFPWNQLGISQWRNLFVLPLCRYTGVYGISFFIVLVNTIIYFSLYQWKIARVERKLSIIWIVPPTLLALISMWILQKPYENPSDHDTIKVAAIQGNIPQIRQWNSEQLDLALEVYTALTKQIVKDRKPDLVVWPETAIPASLIYNEQCLLELKNLFEEIKTPMIAGTISYRFPSDFDQSKEWPKTFNSALLFNESGEVINSYDKIHLVPFGEYIPFEEYLPWLVEWIGMGRSLTEGREYTVIPFLNDAMIGINICFEDIFPEISSRMVLSGANLLLVITNDAWFRESSGSRQHLAHTVFRAVENFRPVLRNGNNSDTCLILPNGEVVDLLYDSENRNRFVRNARVYQVPIWSNPPVTFYSRYGNCFAVVCFVVTVGCALWCFYRFLDRKKRLYALIRQDDIM